MKKLFIALTALAMVAAFSMPAAAQSEVTFGGFVGFETWVHHDRGRALDLDADGLFDDGRYAYTNLQWQLDTVCSRFNASFKRDDFTGFVEMRPRAAGAVGFRHWFAEWNFGPGFLLIGQTWLPTFSPISSSATGCASGYVSTIAGDPGSATARRGMIRLRFPFTVGEFQLALVDPNTGGRTANAAGGQGNVQETQLPQLEGRVNLRFGPVAFNLFGNYNTYKEVYEDLQGLGTINTTEISVKSWVAAANISFTGGPFTLALAGYTGKNNNGRNGFFAGQTDRDLLSPVIVDASGDGLWDSVHDTKDRGAYINARFRLNDMLSFSAGGGMMKQKRNDQFVGTANVNDELVNKASHIFINSTITVAQGFTITPEIGQWGHKTSTLDNFVTRDMGKATYYGIWWMMSF